MLDPSNDLTISQRQKKNKNKNNNTFVNSLYNLGYNKAKSSFTSLSNTNNCIPNHQPPLIQHNRSKVKNHSLHR